MNSTVTVSTDACNACESSGFRDVFQSQDYISRDAFDVMQCDNCGLAITRFDSGRSIGDYYDDLYYGDDANGARFLPVLEKLIGWFRSSRNRYALGFMPPDTTGTALDIGCGRGLLLTGLKSLGWQVHGTEASSEIAKHLKREHNIPVSTELRLSDANYPANHFNLVYSWHTLEHVESPADTVREVYRTLENGGLFIVEVPNFASWQSAIGGPRWFHLDVPRHLFHFSPQVLRGELEGTGFEVISQSTHSLEHGYYGMVQSIMNRLCLHSNFLYHLIRRERPTRTSTARIAFDAVLTAVLLPVVGVVGVVLEGVAALSGRGGVLRFVARKPTTSGSD